MRRLVGGAVLIEMLNILEGYDFKKMDWASSDRYHLMTKLCGARLPTARIHGN